MSDFSEVMKKMLADASAFASMVYKLQTRTP